jgi:hypothetical protein
MANQYPGPPTPQTPFYKAFIRFGNNLLIPALPGMRLTCPKNWAIPPIIGNYWQLNYVEGFRQPTVDVNLVIRDVPSSAPNGLEATSPLFWSYALCRYDTDNSHDTPYIAGGITFWNGRSGFTMYGAKLDSFTLSTAKNEDLTLSCRFIGSNYDYYIQETGAQALSPISSYNPLPYVVEWGEYPPLRFQSCNWANGIVSPQGGSSNLADVVWRYGLSYSNNHHPNMALDGTSFPAAANAGMLTCGLDLTVQADDLEPDFFAFYQGGGGDWYNGYNQAPFGSGLPVNEPAETLLISGSVSGGIGVNGMMFNFPRMIDNTVDNLAVEVPVSMRQHSFTCLGQNSTTGPPIQATIRGSVINATNNPVSSLHEY